MRCVAVCQTAQVARNLWKALVPDLDVEVIVKNRTLYRQLHNAGVSVRVADPRRIDTYVKCDVGPATCVILEDDGQHSVKRPLRAILDAGAVLVYVLTATGTNKSARVNDWRTDFPDVSPISLNHLIKRSLIDALGRSFTRARVKQYQRYFLDANRVLILLHNNPDPDALASGLALRTLLHRTKNTAIIGSFQGITRPENIRMANLLDISVDLVTTDSLDNFDRIATVDVQPNYFGEFLSHVDLVIDHHPDHTGTSATFSDIRPDYGSASTILTEHLQAVEAKISERTATAMLYAIKSDTLFLSRQTNREDLEAFTFLYPLANAALVRKMEGGGITTERLTFISHAVRAAQMRSQIYSTHIGKTPREDLVAYVADFLLQLDNIKWSIVSGQVGDELIFSVRNSGYSRNAGEFVRMYFEKIGRAGGHRAMAKAVVPIGTFRQKFGNLNSSQISALLLKLATEFLANSNRNE
tara:strand:- start:4081 stop:5490 length:1410 start_codon:yes stop_codon:yes gene_type:complete